MSRIEFVRVILLGGFIESFFLLGQNNILFSIIAFVVLLASVLFLKPLESFMVLTFLIPNQRLLVIDSEISIINIPLFILAVKIFSKGFYLPNYNKLLSFLIVLFSLLISLWNSEIMTFLMGVKTILLFYILYYIVSKAVNEDLLYKIVCSFLLGVVFMGITSLFLGDELIIGTKTRLSGGDLNNPNIISSHFSFALSIIAVLNVFKIGRTKNLLLFAILLTILGLLTQSRSFLLSFGIITFIYLLFKLNIKFIFKVLMTLTVGYMSIVLLNLSFISNFFDKLIDVPFDRVVNPRQGDVSAGRTEIWFNYIDVLWNDPISLLFGRGAYKTHLQYGFQHVAHNSIIETVAAIGLIGLFLFLILFYNLYKKMKVYNEKLSFIIYLPLIIIFIIGMTQHTFVNMGTIWHFFIWLSIIPIIINYKNNYI